MMQTMRMLALGVTLTFCALATGAIGLKVYADLSKFRQIDVSSIDLYLGNLSLDHERLRLVYSDDRQDHNPNQVKSDIKHSISVVLAHNAITDKPLKARVIAVLDEIDKTLISLPVDTSRRLNTDILSETLKLQSEKLHSLSVDMTQYLTDVRVSRQLGLSQAVNQFALFAAIMFVTLFAGTGLFMRTHASSKRRAKHSEQA